MNQGKRNRSTLHNFCKSLFAVRRLLLFQNGYTFLDFGQNYNDHKARDKNGQPDTSQMWVINNQALRQLSGCNGMLVKDWMTRYQGAIDNHNNKYGLGTYHNKGRGDITEAISW